MYIPNKQPLCRVHAPVTSRYIILRFSRIPFSLHSNPIIFNCQPTAKLNTWGNVSRMIHGDTYNVQTSAAERQGGLRNSQRSNESVRGVYVKWKRVNHGDEY